MFCSKEGGGRVGTQLNTGIWVEVIGLLHERNTELLGGSCVIFTLYHQNKDTWLCGKRVIAL